MTQRKFQIPFGSTSDHSIDYLLGILYDARVTTLQRVQGLSTEELDWQYREGWNTIGCLLSHIIACEHYFRIVFVEGRELTTAEDEQWLPGLDMGVYIPQLICQRPIEYYVAELATSRQLLLSALQSVNFDTFSKRLEHYDPQTGCNLAWVLYHLAEDEVHHRGQIIILRKLRAAV